MKIIITELEMNAEELRQSNSLSDGVANILRHALQVKTLDELDEMENE